jgi:predicted nuclease with TOPRIM domain
MSKYHQIEVLRILKNTHGLCINENNNGTFVNLTEQAELIITSLEKYASYVDEQQDRLEEIEVEKTRIQDVFFKDNKEIDNIKLS